ncbi:ABC transporter permease [Demequina capsici]|uniref:ABC transporter permease n=1 Tax=Demequina capsici TaxID=3075620 RepID=A0AA96JC90_9MICO|nr:MULTISPECIES: ABC transporter permease [unclassified Demequina]WNM23772.1 ABC transporter permease [Demequina sp. OYTSA14]WNM26611.1 ABC transporter permease [Demequina sp. PMTSA13]
MLGFVGRRIVTGVGLIATLATLTFFLLQFGSTDTARRIAGQAATEDAVNVVKERLGLDQPVLVRFWDWVTAAVHGDFGKSWFSGQDVVEAVTTRMQVTVTLAVGSVVLTALIAVVLGALAATRRGWLDRAVQVLSVIGQAIPGFLVALVLVLIFAIRLDWFPATGYTKPSDDVGQWLLSIALPITALTIGSIGGVAQQVRGSMLDAFERDYVRTLRSRGLPHRTVVYKHVLRNAAGPALSILGLQFVILLGGAVIVEQLFSIPGIGPAALSATSQGDIPVVMGIVVLTGLIVILVNTLVDVAQAWVNPKVRLS